MGGGRSRYCIALGFGSNQVARVMDRILPALALAWKIADRQCLSQSEHFYP